MRRAGIFHHTTSGDEFIANLSFRLGVETRDVERQAPHLLPDLDAEETSPELVQGEIFSSMIDLALAFRRSAYALWPAEFLPGQHEGAEDEPQQHEKLVRFTSYLAWK